MLKINLIPAYLAERRKLKQTTITMAILVIGVAVGSFAWVTMLEKQRSALEQETIAMEGKAAEVNAIKAQAEAEEAKAPPLQSKVSFFDAMAEYNNSYPKLYAELAKYTYSRVLYRSIDPSGGQLKISANARSVGDCGRYLLNMYRATHLFNSVTIDAIPSWSGSIPQGFSFNVTCNLVKPITAPAYSASGAPAPPQ